MELTELKNRIINAFNGTKQDLRLLLETVENDKEGIYPFNGFELLLSTCISNGNITYKKYRELRHEYFVNNPNLWIFEISAPRGFGEQFAQTFLRNKSSKLEIPNSRKDPNYHGQYDLWLDGIRIEVKASRVTDANSDSSVPLYKKALSHNTKQPFFNEFPTIKTTML